MQSKKVKTPEQLNAHLAEQLEFVKITGDVYMNYVCGLGSEVIFKEQHLKDVGLAYIRTIQQVNDF